MSTEQATTTIVGVIALLGWIGFVVVSLTVYQMKKEHAEALEKLNNQMSDFMESYTQIADANKRFAEGRDLAGDKKLGLLPESFYANFREKVDRETESTFDKLVRLEKEDKPVVGFEVGTGREVTANADGSVNTQGDPNQWDQVLQQAKPGTVFFAPVDSAPPTFDETVGLTQQESAAGLPRLADPELDSFIESLPDIPPPPVSRETYVAPTTPPEVESVVPDWEHVGYTTDGVLEDPSSSEEEKPWFWPPLRSWNIEARFDEVDPNTLGLLFGIRPSYFYTDADTPLYTQLRDEHNLKVTS